MTIWAFGRGTDESEALAISSAYDDADAVEGTLDDNDAVADVGSADAGNEVVVGERG